MCVCMRVSTREREKKNDMQAIYKLSADFNNLAPGTKVSESVLGWGGGGGVDERGIQTLAHRQTQNIASQRNARAHSPTLRRIRMHARTHARTHAHMHTCTHARKNARTHAHTHTHTETHTHTHTHRNT